MAKGLLSTRSFSIRPKGYDYPVGLTSFLETGNAAETTTGGTQTMDGDNATHTFTTTGEFIPAFTSTVEVLIVGGGGGGGGQGGNGTAGGGGAGGLAYISNIPVVINNVYSITVGSGGSGETNPWPGGSPNKTSGEPSTFIGGTALSNVTVAGGGHGGSLNSYNAAPGGSGGGGGGGEPGPAPNKTGAGVANSSQGFPGGSGGGPFAPTGGGGGAAGAGATNGAAGGGLEYSISGSPLYYAAGGGGYFYNGTAFKDGIGAAGAQGNPAASNNPQGPGVQPAVNSGVLNRGSGGGGGANRGTPSYYHGTNGTDGVCIVRYQTTQTVTNYRID
jgi:hypothetical protein